jgi:hypothetical protein
MCKASTAAAMSQHRPEKFGSGILSLVVFLSGLPSDTSAKGNDSEHKGSPGAHESRGFMNWTLIKEPQESGNQEGSSWHRGRTKSFVRLRSRNQYFLLLSIGSTESHVCQPGGECWFPFVRQKNLRLHSCSMHQVAVSDRTAPLLASSVSSGQMTWSDSTSRRVRAARTVSARR